MQPLGLGLVDARLAGLPWRGRSGGSTSTIVPSKRTSSLATSKCVGLKVRVVFHHAVDPPAQDAVERAGHADVALKGRAAGQDAFVGRGHVRVRAQHGADAAVEIAAHQLLVAGGLGVKVDAGSL